MLQTDWIWVLPWSCAFLWTAGGRPKGRYFRRLGLGIAVATFSYAYTRDLTCFACIPTYHIATSIGYGKYIQDRNWPMIAVIGALYGAASFPVATAAQSSLWFYQVALAATGFTGCVWFSNAWRYRLHWAIAEALTGLSATFLIPFMISYPGI